MERDKSGPVRPRLMRENESARTPDNAAPPERTYTPEGPEAEVQMHKAAVAAPLPAAGDVWDTEDDLIEFEERLKSEVGASSGLDSEEAVIAFITQRFEAFTRQRTSNGKSNLSAQLLDTLISRRVGYGPLSPLLRDPRVSEIMVNGKAGIDVEQGGQLAKTNLQLTESQRQQIAHRLVSASGRHPVSDVTPSVDAYLPDGTRIIVTHHSVSDMGTQIVIRKHNAVRMTLTDLVRNGALSMECAQWMRLTVQGRANLLISGGTSSGKTTLLNALLSVIPEHERIGIIEDTPELNVSLPHIYKLHSKPGSNEGTFKGYTIRDAVKDSLRMRPNRIIVGECRAAETLDMLQAMNTGHDGSMTTNHANSASEALDRVETMCFMGAGENFPIKSVRRQIQYGIDLVLFIVRLPDGTRRVAEIKELVNVNEDGQYVLQDLWLLDRSGVPTLRPTGHTLSRGLMERMKANGVDVEVLKSLTLGGRNNG